MQIKNRLKKMEKQIIGSGSEFCACRETPKHEFIRYEDGIETITNPVAESCDNCGKPIEKLTIVFGFSESKI